MERFRKDHPNDPAGNLVSIDYYLLKKDYDESVKMIDRLDESLGGDPYLALMKAGVLADAGRFKEARAAADQAIKDAPKLPQAYWMRATVSTKAKDHKDTLACLKTLVEKVEPNLAAGDLPADERFVEFVKTPQFDEFKKWLAERAK
jgi:tetratricopeptide (TPR) repeat protein